MLEDEILIVLHSFFSVAHHFGFLLDELNMIDKAIW